MGAGNGKRELAAAFGSPASLHVDWSNTPRYGRKELFGFRALRGRGMESVLQVSTKEWQG